MKIAPRLAVVTCLVMLVASTGCRRPDTGVRQDVVVNSSASGTEYAQAAAVTAIIEK